MHFTVVTDHALLQWLQNLKDPSGRLARWALRLRPYNLTLVHRPGRFMTVADALSQSVDAIDVTCFAKSDDRLYKDLKSAVSLEPDKYSQYKIKNEMLYKHCSYNSHGLDQSIWRLVVPKETRDEVLKQCHDDPLSAHGGRHKTIARVSQDFYWPKMYECVSRYVRNCQVCSATKSTNIVQRAPMG